MENASITVTSLHKPSEKQNVPICPECGSVFITKKSCEACGFQFFINRLGEPMGDRSYYFLEESYWDKRNIFYRYFRRWSPKDDSKARKYVRSLRKRYEVLIKYFFESVDVNRTRRRLFLFELQDLLKELAFFRVKSRTLVWVLQDNEAHPLSPAIAGYIEEAFETSEKRKFSSREIWDQRFLGLLRYGFVTRLIIGSSALIWASLLFFKFLSK